MANDIFDRVVLDPLKRTNFKVVSFRFIPKGKFCMLGREVRKNCDYLFPLINGVHNEVNIRIDHLGKEAENEIYSNLHYSGGVPGSP